MHLKRVFNKGTDPLLKSKKRNYSKVSQGAGLKASKVLVKIFLLGMQDIRSLYKSCLSQFSQACLLSCLFLISVQLLLISVQLLLISVQFLLPSVQLLLLSVQLLLFSLHSTDSSALYSATPVFCTASPPTLYSFSCLFSNHSFTVQPGLLA